MKEKILRIRPFNMANFSSGAGVLAFVGFFMWICIFPAAFIVWTGFALSLKSESGNINYHVLVRRLNRVLLPICLVLFVILSLFLLWSTAFYSGYRYILLLLWIALFPSVGIFAAARISLDGLNDSKPEGFTKGQWLLRLLVTAVILKICGIIGTFVFSLF
jgi:hypothetical protein